jgi:hypothetical protein|tara:strand:- start:376 stop:681 length:306 start_codon:yes stop_codon:yes gene_type:complete
MKKLLISVSALCLMSFTSTQIYKQYKLGEAINHIQDMKEWMLQDVESGKIDPELGESYMYWLELTEDELIEFANNNRITTPHKECDGYEVDSNGVVTNFEF